MPGTLIIKRRGYKRRGYRREDGVYTHPAQVPGVTFRIKDRGRPGRGPSLIKNLKKGFMTKQAINLGYIQEGQTISDIPNSKMDDFARDLVKKVGAERASRMVNAQINLRSNESGGFKSKMLIANGAIRKKSKVLKVGRG